MIIQVTQDEYKMIREALVCYVDEIDRNVRHLNGDIKSYQWRLDGLIHEITGIGMKT